MTQVNDYDGKVFVLHVYDEGLAVRVFTTLEVANAYRDKFYPNKPVTIVECDLIKELD